MSDNRVVILSRDEDNSEEVLAKFVAELVRQGVNFHVTANTRDYIIRFNGGY